MAAEYGTLGYYQEQAEKFSLDCERSSAEFLERKRLLAIEQEQARADVRWRMLMCDLNNITPRVVSMAKETAYFAIKELCHGC
jgi:hypothetical protein